MIYLYWLVVIWNLFVMVLYGIDKRRIKAQKTKIETSLLLLLSLLGASFGAAMGMLFFNHKVNERTFRIFIPLAAALNVVLFFIWYR